MDMKKGSIVLLLLVSLFIAACSNNTKGKEVDEVVKVGIRGSELRTWEFIKEQAKEQGIEIELVNFSSAYDPNEALALEEVAINAHQHIAYLDYYNESKNTDLVPIGTTIMAPLGLYSSKYRSIDEIPDGAQIAVPNDATNWGRALLLLQEAGFLTVVDGFDGNGGEDKVKENLKNIEIVPVDAANAPRTLEDTAGSIINNGIAVEAGLSLKDALIHESKTAKPYINVIAAKEKNKDKEILQKIVDIYQTDETAKFIEETYKGNFIPTYITLEELSTYKDAYQSK